MALKLIRLELARAKDFPEGSANHGYEFVAPVAPDGCLDAIEWRRMKNRCSVLRFWGDEDAQEGFLRHVGNGWRFDYNEHDGTDSEPFFRLDKHVIEPGTYVTISEHDGVQRPFKIVQVSYIN